MYGNAQQRDEAAMVSGNMQATLGGLRWETTFGCMIYAPNQKTKGLQHKTDFQDK